MMKMVVMRRERAETLLETRRCCDLVTQHDALMMNRREGRNVARDAAVSVTAQKPLIQKMGMVGDGATGDGKARDGAPEDADGLTLHKTL